MSQFSGHSSALWPGGLGSRPSEISLVNTVSAFPQPPSRLCGPGAPTPDASRSMWYTETPTIKDSLKALLHSPTPNSSTEPVQYPGASASIKRPIHGLRNIPSVFPLLSQLSRPSTSTSPSASSIFKPERPELSRSLDQPATTSIHSSQQSPFGLDNKETSPSEQLPNVSKSTDTPNGSESYRRPLPKPPRESALRRTQSSTPSTATSALTFRSLPPTPLIEVSEPNESRPSVSGNSRIHSPPMKKETQELTRWVHELTDPQQVLSTTPSPGTEVFDLPPPSYTSIYFAQGDKPKCITTPTATAPST